MILKYTCGFCKYDTDNKKDYNRHLTTKKHKNLVSNKHKNLVSNKHYICSVCNFTTYNRYDYQRHMSTQKHLFNVNNKTTDSQNEYSCEICDRRFKYLQNLSRHKSKCKPVEKDTTIESLDSFREHQKTLSEQYNAMVVHQQDIVEQQHDMMNEIMAKVSENCSITNITNNNNNVTNKFNLNFFLNETCKNAMSINYFLNNLNIQVEDIEYVGNHGYVEGMTHIIMDRLNALDITERPIHCTDVKRDTMHIKCDDAWHKDIDDEKIQVVVSSVSKLNYRKIPDWTELHPHCFKTSSPDFDYHLKMLGNVLGSHQDQSLDRKVIKNIAKQTALNRQVLAQKYGSVRPKTSRE